MPPNQPNYDFIMNPQQQPTGQSRLPGNNSTLMRAVFVLGGLTLLLIIALIVKSFIGGNKNMDTLLPVVQDQAAILELLTVSEENQDSLSLTSRSFAATAGASLKSSQSEMIKYMNLNNYNVNQKQLALKTDAAASRQLTSAANNGTFESTFRSVMKDKLEAYQGDLQTAYGAVPGPNAKQRLKSDYDQAKLLIQQLEGR